MAASIASPQDSGLPTGRRLPYGITARVSAIDAKNDTRNATFIPGHSNGSIAIIGSVCLSADALVSGTP